MASAMAEEKRSPMVDEHMSVPAAARATGLSRPGVLGAALRGELVADIVAGRTVIRRDSVEAWKARQADSK